MRPKWLHTANRSYNVRSLFSDADDDEGLSLIVAPLLAVAVVLAFWVSQQ